MIDTGKFRLTVAKNIGEPINPNLPVPVELGEIADVDTANPGEKVYRFDDIDTRVDTIIAVGVARGLTNVNVSPLGDAEVSFSHLNSEKLYIYVPDVLDSIDLDVLGRKKSRISHGMDKRELKLILDACIARSALGESSIIPLVTPTSGDDLNHRGRNSAVCEKLFKKGGFLTMEKYPSHGDNSAGKTFKSGFELGRFVCAIETEGHITLAWGKRGNGTIQLSPRIGFCNKDKELIDEIQRISYSLGIGTYIYRQSNKMYRLVWQGMKRVKKVLDLIIPHLVIKVDQAKLLKKFVDYRLSLPNMYQKMYGQFEKDLFLQIRKLNGKGRNPTKQFLLAFENVIPRDYTPNTSENQEKK